MNLTYAIIINDNIVYISNKEEEPKVEVSVFTLSLLKLLSRESWRLHKIILQPISEEIIESNPKNGENKDSDNFDKNYDPNNPNNHDFNKNEMEYSLLFSQINNKSLGLNILYCVFGHFHKGAMAGYELLELWNEEINKIYSPEQLLEISNSDIEVLKAVCNDIVLVLNEKYSSMMDSDKLFHEEFCGDPGLLYIGLSCQGLPIVSKLFGINLFNLGMNLSEEEFVKRNTFIESTISGHLATISMNSYIRAKSFVKSVQFIIDEEPKTYGFINFEHLGISKLYTLEVFTMGCPASENNFIKRLRNTTDNFECLQKPFSGHLKEYSSVKEFLEKVKFP